jgi:hypothetical protein
MTHTLDGYVVLTGLVPNLICISVPAALVTTENQALMLSLRSTNVSPVALISVSAATDLLLSLHLVLATPIVTSYIGPLPSRRNI